MDIITHGRPFLTSRQHWWERVDNTVIEFHPSETSGSSRARTQTARLLDRDANDCAISVIFPRPLKTAEFILITNGIILCHPYIGLNATNTP